MENRKAVEVLTFWKELGPQKWWRKDDAVDDEIRHRFLSTHELASNGKLDDWQETADDCLALVIVLDQFSRNLFRNSAQAFDHDPMALAVAKNAIARGFDHKADPTLSTFFYLPFMHAEDLGEQEKCVELMRKTGNEPSLKAAIEHRDIIQRFGRFPHRNEVLGRETTDAEQAFLDAGGFKG